MLEEQIEHVEKEGASTSQLIILFLSVFVDLLGFGIIIPILPILNRDLGGDSLDYGIIIAIYSFMQFIFSPIWGSISDKVGRKPIILIGLGGSSFGFALFAYATDLWLLYFARALAGIFTAATLTTANAFIADVTPPEDRGGAFSLISAAFGLGFALGPGLGGLLAGFTRYDYLIDDLVPVMGTHVLPSFAAAVLAIISMLGALRFLPESLDRSIVQNVEGRSRFPIMDTFNYRDSKNSLLYIFTFSFIAFGLSSFITAFPQYALEYGPHIDAESLGLYFTFIGIMLFTIQTFLIRPLIKRLGEALLVKIGLILVISGFIGTSLAPTYTWTFLPNGLFVTGIAFLLPTMTSLVSNSASAEDQGNILGISQGWSAFMRVLGPIFAGYIFEFGETLPFLVGAAIYAVLLLVTIRRFDESPGKL